jgi:hypothetical protein
VANTFRNARFAGSVSAVRAEDFRGGHFSSIAHYSGSQIGAAGMVTGRMPITPSAANLRFSDRAAAGAPRGGVASNTHFFTHQQPGGAQRIPFSQQQRGFESAGAGRTGGAGSPAGIGAGNRESSGFSRGGAPTVGGSTSSTPGNWRRFGDTPAQTPGAGTRGVAGTAGEYRGAGNGGVQNNRPPASSYGNGVQRPSSTGGQSQQSVRVAPPVAHERSSAPSYSAPRSSGGGGGSSHPSGGGHSGGGGHGHR